MDGQIEFDENLKTVWVDLCIKFGKAVATNDLLNRDSIIDAIQNLEKIYPQMKQWYLHTMTED